VSDARACVICSNADGRPNDVIAELDASWLSAPPEAPLPGYVCVVAKRHLVEPFELSDEEQAAFPRYDSDPYEGGPITLDSRLMRSPEQLEAIARAVLEMR
jgi:hypothetical protein